MREQLNRTEQTQVNSLPRVLYHGTFSDAEVPSIEFAKKGAAIYTPAIFLAEDRNLAGLSARGGKIRTLELDPNANLLDFEEPGILETENTLRQHLNLPQRTQEDWARISQVIERSITNRDIYQSILGEINRKEIKTKGNNIEARTILHNALKQAGYDGFIYNAAEENGDDSFHGKAVALLRDGLLNSVPE